MNLVLHHLPAYHSKVSPQIWLRSAIALRYHIAHIQQQFLKFLNASVATYLNVECRMRTNFLLRSQVLMSILYTQQNAKATACSKELDFIDTFSFGEEY